MWVVNGYEIDETANRYRSGFERRLVVDANVRLGWREEWEERSSQWSMLGNGEKLWAASPTNTFDACHLRLETLTNVSKENLFRCMYPNARIA
jgi:hypothetical protein